MLSPFLFTSVFHFSPNNSFILCLYLLLHTHPGWQHHVTIYNHTIHVKNIYFLISLFFLMRHLSLNPPDKKHSTTSILLSASPATAPSLESHPTSAIFPCPLGAMVIFKYREKSRRLLHAKYFLCRHTRRSVGMSRLLSNLQLLLRVQLESFYFCETCSNRISRCTYYRGVRGYSTYNFVRKMRFL